MLHGTWDLPGSGIQPISPSVAGGCFTTESSENREVQGHAVEHTLRYGWWMGLLYRNLTGISVEGQNSHGGSAAHAPDQGAEAVSMHTAAP